jgi:ribose transport system ATP-binding protein
MTTHLLEFQAIEKAFFGVRVLKGVSFVVPAGGMLGLVGENGAGKSTLMNVLGGNVKPDAGRMLLNGSPYAPADPKAAQRSGVAFIHQELNLFPNLTIAENLFLNHFPRLGASPFIDRGQLREQAAKLLAEVGLQMSPERLVETLSAGERQLLEVARALNVEARLIIFDEPTTSLTQPETERLFALIHRLRARGIAMIYISHTLAHVLQLCNALVVLRDGEVVGTGPAEVFTPGKLISLMVGRPLEQLFPTRVKTPSSKPLLEVRDLSRGTAVRNVSFTLHQGEVLGLAGLMGAGRSELARLLFGLDSHDSGEIRLDGQTVHDFSPRELMRKGMALLTENRRSEGLCLDASMADNLLLPSLPEHGRGWLRWLRKEALQEAVRRIREVVRLDAKARDTQSVRTLSGGNQQKVVLGKWLLRQPRVLILDEPTRGIDVGARFEIYRLVQELADHGAGVLVISSELEELLGLCDRILVMRKGTLTGELPKSEFNSETILRAALGGLAPEAASTPGAA